MPQSSPIVCVESFDATYVQVRQLNSEDRARLNMDPVCARSAELLCHICSCFLLTVIVPLCILLPLSMHENDELSDGYAIGFGVPLGAGVLYFLYLSRPVLLDGGLTIPRKPPPVKPFCNQTAEDMNTVPEGVSLHRTPFVIMIVNPVSGYGRGKVVMETVVRGLAERGIRESNTLIFWTSRANHGREIAMTELAVEQLLACTCLIVIGGDGSFHDVTNGLLGRSDVEPDDLPPVCLIPGGSGNSVSADMFSKWVPTDKILEMYFDRAGSVRKVVKMDVNQLEIPRMCDAEDVEGGEVFDRIVSVNTICLGLTGEVGVMAESLRFLGMMRYDLLALWLVLKGYSVELNVEKSSDFSNQCEDVDRLKERLSRREYLTLIVNNTQHFGNSIRCTRYATLDDGKFDCVSVPSGILSRGQQLAVFSQIREGRHLNGRLVGDLVEQGKSVVVEVLKKKKRGTSCD